MASFLGHPSLHSFHNCPKLHFSQNPKPLRFTITYASLPARDRIIDFGKYKGRMLGTLPSTYLKWVSNNLRARDFEEWANLADQVLQDPIYNDRVEWEYAQKLLNGDVLNTNSKSEGIVTDLLEISERFGWDNEDKIGWKKIDFEMLGTSRGGRIPRLKVKKDDKLMKSKIDEDRNVELREKRDARRDRLQSKRSIDSEKKKIRVKNVVEIESKDKRNKNLKSKEKFESNTDVYNPFPGREMLLRNVINRRGIKLDI
ncbi:unnamed protein product [Amaranthus hypochondriacus]